ncbi:hypothetical protein KY284_020414 [Solanum tuberosum]|nr:hypothetical protein KY284_020414 [Solanum tuberosum]
MVTETSNLLRVWWNNLNAYQKRKLSIYLGHLLSIMNLKVWPKFIEVVTQFWDNERMVFRFRDVEMTPTVEEIKDCLDNVGMSQKRKNHPDHHILLPDKPTSLELKNMLVLWMSKHLVKTYETQKQKLTEPKEESHLDHYELHLSINKFKIHNTRETWAKVFHDIRDGNVQWMFQDFMLEKIVVQGAKCPFLILPGIRGVQPYNPSRVMRQFCRKQILPFKGDTSHYIFDYNGCDKIPYAKDIRQEWDDLRRTLDPTPRTGRQIEDVRVRLQIQAYHFQQEALAFVTQELTDTRACLIRLDSNLDNQLSTLRSVAMSSKAVFAIREEVEKAKGGAGPSTL